MKGVDSIKTLYSNNIDDIIDAINESVYVTDLKKVENEVVIHSGFTFQLQTGKKFELYIDIFKGILIRQPIMNTTTLSTELGVIYIRRAHYFDATLISCINGVDVVHETIDMANFDTVKEFREYLASHKSFNIYHNSDKGEEENKIELPLKKDFKTILFYNGRNFARYVSREE